MRNYYEKMKSEGFPYKGMLHDYDMQIEGEGCSGAGNSDEIVFYIKLDGSSIKNIHYICNYCIPPSYIVATAFCTFAFGKDLKVAKNMTKEDLYSIIGGKSEKIYNLLKDSLKKFADLN